MMHLKACRPYSLRKVRIRVSCLTALCQHLCSIILHALDSFLTFIKALAACLSPHQVQIIDSEDRVIVQWGRHLLCIQLSRIKYLASHIKP